MVIEEESYHHNITFAPSHQSMASKQLSELSLPLAFSIGMQQSWYITPLTLFSDVIEENTTVATTITINNGGDPTAGILPSASTSTATFATSTPLISFKSGF